MKRFWSFALILILCLSFSGCGKVKSTDLSNVVINGYAVQEGENDVCDKAISKDDVIAALGKEYKDELYDYSQAMRVMKYHDDDGNIEMDFVYLPDSGKTINWIYMNSEE